MNYTIAHLRSKGHLLNPALKEIRRTRTKRFLQSHAKNGHKNVLFRGEIILTNKEQYNMNNKIYAQMFLQVHSELVWAVPSGNDTASFWLERCEN